MLFSSYHFLFIFDDLSVLLNQCGRYSLPSKKRECQTNAKVIKNGNMTTKKRHKNVIIKAQKKHLCPKWAKVQYVKQIIATGIIQP